MSLTKYQPKISEDIRKAEQIAESVEDEIYELIRYLKSAISLVDTIGTDIPGDRESVRQRLSELLKKSKDLGSEASSKVSKRLKQAWDEAKNIVGQNIVEETWDSLFSSREWKHFFIKHPNLDPNEWKHYLQESLPSPKYWREALEDAASSFVSSDDRAKYPLQESGFGQYSSLVCAVSICYMIYAMGRAAKIRSQTSFPFGDGSLQVSLLQDVQEKEKRVHDSERLQRALDTIRHASFVLPVALLGIYLLEVHYHVGGTYLISVAVSLLTGLLITNELSIINRANEFYRPVGDFVMRLSLGVIAAWLFWSAMSYEYKVK